MIVNLPLMNTGVTSFTVMSNLELGAIAGKSKVLASNIKQSSSVIQSMVRGALSKGVEAARRIDLKA